VDRITGEVEPGDIVDVYYGDDKFAGKGYINPKSQILVRLLTRKQEEINEQFFHDRVAQAWRYRQKIGYTENCRLIFGEADQLPALVVDKFNDYFVIQTLSLGIDKWKDGYRKSITIHFFSQRGSMNEMMCLCANWRVCPSKKGF
jgi:23S rRNA (cytosine1962-C5)-methyltransferase